jgi:hypothetical protein
MGLAGTSLFQATMDVSSLSRSVDALINATGLFNDACRLGQFIDAPTRFLVLRL